jgi:hypothetical protein
LAERGHAGEHLRYGCAPITGDQLRPPPRRCIVEAKIAGRDER